jgi:PAS domain S-box-containing protein
MVDQKVALSLNSDFFVQSLFNQSIDGIMVIDSEGVVQLANERAKEILASHFEPLEGHHLEIPLDESPVEIQVDRQDEIRTVEIRVNKVNWHKEDAYIATVRDITHQVQVQNELREQEDKYRQFFNNSINGYLLGEIIFDEDDNPIDGAILDVNQSFESMFETKKEDILERSVLGLFPPEEIEVFLKSIGRIAKTGISEQFEYHFNYLAKDFLIAAYVPQKNRVAIVFSDTTQCVNAENRHREDEKRYRTLFETMSQGVIYMDNTGRLLSVNPAAERILGIRLSNNLGEIIPYSPDDIFRLDLTIYPEYKYPHNLALRTGRRVEDSVMGFRHSNRQELTWLNISAIPLYDEETKDINQIVMTFIDITDRIRIQKALQERVKELNCIAKISNAIQKNLSISEICHITVREVADAMQFPDDAYVDIELGGERYTSEGFSKNFKQHIKAPIRIRDQGYGDIAVYYSEDRPFILPEEFNFLSGIAERLASYYEHRQILGQLRRSEERFRKALMDSPIPIMLFAEDGEILFVNNAWIRISGYSREEIPTIDDWLRNAHREKHEEIAELFQEKYRTSHGAEEMETYIVAKNGEKRLWQITTSQLETLQDGRKAAISMARDVTERRQAVLEREHYYERITALREVDQVVGSTLDLDNVLGRITSELQKLISYDSMSVMLLNGENLKIIACQGFDNPDEILGMTFPSTPEYPNYEVIEENKPACYENISEVYPLFHQPIEGSSRPRIKTWLGVPLAHQDEVIGIFTIDRYEENLFSEDDIAVAMEFANRAAIAIINAQLYEQTIQQVEKLEILRKIDAVITGSMNLHTSLMEILVLIQKGLDVDAVSIILYDEEKEILTSERGVGFASEVDSSIEINLGQGFSGHIALEREPLYIPDVTFKKTKNKYPVDLSAEDITSYYGLPLIARGKLEGVLQIYNHARLDPDEDWVTFADALAGQAAIAVYNISLFAGYEQANRDLVQAYDATIEGWAHALELRDKETVGHSRRVADLSLRIARRFGFDEEALHHIRRGVLLHDIGKMGIPDEILHKPGPLTEEEWDIMHLHPGFAYDMLKDIEYLQPALKIPHYHHERWDGSGYPEGLIGEEIPMEARIFAVVDIWDALISDRYYRPAWSREKALEYVKKESGNLLDPDVVAVFLEIINGE